MAMMALKAARASSRKRSGTREQSPLPDGIVGKNQGERQRPMDSVLPSAAKGSSLGGKAVDRATSGAEERRRKLMNPSTLVGGGTR